MSQLTRRGVRADCAKPSGNKKRNILLTPARINYSISFFQQGYIVGPARPKENSRKKREEFPGNIKLICPFNFFTPPTKLSTRVLKSQRSSFRPRKMLN